MAAAERRAEAEGIKRALGHLTVSHGVKDELQREISLMSEIQAAAGVLNYIIDTLLPTIKTEVSTPTAAGYDMTPSFLGTMKEFVMAEAQECYWQQAVLRLPISNLPMRSQP